MGLTKNQKKAMNINDGNVLVNAGAGSGKTTLFTGRIARLIKQGYALPEEILGLTFTNEAAENMRVKIGKLIPKEDAALIELSTFHSFALKELKRKYPMKYANGSIMKSWWRFQTLNNICAKQSNHNEYGMNLGVKAGDLGSFISTQKMNMLRHGDQIIRNSRTTAVDKVSDEDLQAAFDTYCEIVDAAKLFDFDDMLLDFYYLLSEDERFLERIRSRYDYVMVDEFQDTNKVSSGILELITRNNLFAVGDFRQGIYGFINASIDNILDFHNTFEDVVSVSLEENFRSTKNIVAISNKIIEVSPVEKYKNFPSQIAASDEVGEPILFKAYQTESDEARAIAEKIDELVMTGQHDYKDFAIIIRTNTTLGIYESVLSSQEIPITVSGGHSFFDKREIADLIGYLEHISDEEDDNSLRRILNSPNRFISSKSKTLLDKKAHSDGTSLEQAFINHARLLGYAQGGASELMQSFDEWRNYAEHNSVSAILKKVLADTRFLANLEKTSPTVEDYEMKKEGIESFLRIAKKYKTIPQFLMQVEKIKQNGKKSIEDSVRIMTAHASKGLEFEYVFAPCVTSKNFPHAMNPDIEEERRLFYVIASRAKKKLEISIPVFESEGGVRFQPSNFLLDIAAEEINKLVKPIVRGSHMSETQINFA